MDLRRLRAGEWIAALGGGLLLFSLFLGWYEVPVPSVAIPAGSEAETAWEAFAVNDLLLAIVAVCALSLVPITASHRVPAIPLALDALVAIAGKLALLLVLIRIAWHPGGATGLELGAWLGLLGTAVIVAGGWTAMRDERLSSEGRPTDLTGRPRAEPPAIETLPAP
jgi:hypothetical protein